MCAAAAGTGSKKIIIIAFVQYCNLLIICLFNNIAKRRKLHIKSSVRVCPTPPNDVAVKTSARDTQNTPKSPADRPRRGVWLARHRFVTYTHALRSAAASTITIPPSTSTMNSGVRMTQPGTPVLHPNYLKVFVQRDYSDGTSVKFQTRFPAELEGRVSDLGPFDAERWSVQLITCLCTGRSSDTCSRPPSAA